MSAFAVHELKFQLDGNALSTVCGTTPDGGPSGANACQTQIYDWGKPEGSSNTNNIFNSTNSVASVNTSLVDPTNTTGFTAAGFNRDFGVKVSASDNCSLTNTSSTTFCTADTTTYATGSKDIQNISGGGADQSGNWQCNKDNNVNSKIDIMNAYSAVYKDPASSDTIIYFALEKNKDNGNNNAGFWFLQGDAACVSTGGATNFTGNHQNGDVLVTSAFTSGGGVSNIQVFRWSGGADGCIDSNPAAAPACDQLPIASGGDCKSTTGAHTICATTNSGAKVTNTNVTVPWLTADATLGVGHTVVPPDFFEGGIDITKVFQQAGGTAPSCFTTFIADTRSSQSPTATLFDFSRGRLGDCTTTLATEQQNTSSPSIGTGTVSSGTDKATLTVTGSSVWGGTLTWWLCGPVSSDGCDSHGVQVTSRTVSNSSPASDFISGTATLTSVGRYCWHAHFEPDAASKLAGVKPADDNGAKECFSVTPVKPTLTTSASCTSTPCVLGVDTLSDTATLTGTAGRPGDNGPGGDTGLYKSINATNGAPADSTIDWTLYGPAGDGCTASKLTTSRTVSGDGQYPATGQSAVSYKPVVADGIGTYTFVAKYDGDSPNTSAADPTSCPDTSGTETVTVTGSASSASKQRWLPNDRVVLSTTAGTLNGTLKVTLYKGTFTGTAANCAPSDTATAVSGQAYTFPISGDASGSAYNTNNSTFFVGTKPDGTAGGDAGDYFWLVQYNDDNLTDPNDRCESSNVTITD